MKSQMQKLVTIYLDALSYHIIGKHKPHQCHGMVEEHLENYLDNGWEIKEITAGGGGSASEVAGWVVVLLEKL